MIRSNGFNIVLSLCSWKAVKHCKCVRIRLQVALVLLAIARHEVRWQTIEVKSRCSPFVRLLSLPRIARNPALGTSGRSRGSQQKARLGFAKLRSSWGIYGGCHGSFQQSTAKPRTPLVKHTQGHRLCMSMGLLGPGAQRYAHETPLYLSGMRCFHNKGFNASIPTPNQAR